MPTEHDVKKWVKEAIQECLVLPSVNANNIAGEPLLDRKETAKILRVSLVTLTDWAKRGYHFTRTGGGFIFCGQKLWSICV